MLGLPQLGPDTELVEGRQPLHAAGWAQLGRGGFVPAEGEQWGSASGGCAQQNLHLPWWDKMCQCIPGHCLTQPRLFWRWAVTSLSTGALKPLCWVLLLKWGGLAVPCHSEGSRRVVGAAGTECVLKSKCVPGES